jgi:hypothetical protein
MGVPWPLSVAVSGNSIGQGETKLWSFRPVEKVTPPQVRNVSWVKTPVDRFILTKLESKGQEPAEPAERLTLLRRATYDLTGLPPTEQEIQAFLSDSSAEAHGKAVDRLLASPH